MIPRVAILTISDSAVSGARLDASGPALREHCLTLGWPIAAESLVADEASLIAAALAAWADTQTADVILTTGGTGVAPRDVTPEATRSILDREIPGVSELLRAKGLEQTKYSVLARGLAGSRKQAFIVNFPGSPAGALFSLKAIEHLIPHIVHLLRGKTDHACQASPNRLTGNHY
jgi:molybdenum cofactor synthesis domain-containing protein